MLNFVCAVVAATTTFGTGLTSSTTTLQPPPGADYVLTSADCCPGGFAWMKPNAMTPCDGDRCTAPTS